MNPDTVRAAEELQNDLYRHCNSFERLPELLRRAPRGSRRNPLAWGTWFRVLGEIWSDCDNINVFAPVLRARFTEHRDCWESMMTPSELEAYRALPDSVTLYRGCGPDNLFGLSWTTSPIVAAKFPTLNRYFQEVPLLITAQVPKQAVVAIKTDRNEEEVIAFVKWENVESIRRIAGRSGGVC